MRTPPARGGVHGRPEAAGEAAGGGERQERRPAIKAQPGGPAAYLLHHTHHGSQPQQHPQQQQSAAFSAPSPAIQKQHQQHYHQQQYNHPHAPAAQQPVSAAAAAVVPPESLRLLGPTKWEFDSAGAAKVLLDYGGDFPVVGVLGTQGAGKSSLLNALLYDSPAAATAAATAATATAATGSAVGSGGGGGVPSSQLLMPPFAVQASSPPHHHTSHHSHATSGLELRVHAGDRTLLLDTPPLWSASWLAELASAPEPPLAYGNIAGGPSIVTRAMADARSCGSPAVLAAEGAAELVALQLGALLLAACHVVVLMVEDVDEPRLWEYLQVIDLVAHSLPDLGVAAAAAAATTGGGAGGPTAPLPPAVSTGGARRVAELVVVQVGVHGDFLTLRHLRPRAQLLRAALHASTRLLSACPAEQAISILRYLGGGGGGGSSGGGCGSALSVVSNGNATGLPAAAPLAAAAGSAGEDGAAAGGRSRRDGVQSQQSQQATVGGGGADSSAGGGALHFWALPRPQRHTSASSASSAALGGDAALLPLRSALLALPRRPLSLSSSASAASSLSAAALASSASPLSERDWLRGVERLWGVELQRSAVLERYFLALQRSGGLAGGGGWPLGSCG